MEYFRILKKRGTQRTKRMSAKRSFIDWNGTSGWTAIPSEAGMLGSNWFYGVVFAGDGSDH